ncbi:hypothetical protein CPB84DRAFT_79701 [Gymnopilus junonius]|uniref:SET domain-containing protein n=1 Tax=Gymnopilus junonius TaxID=109634 RepID=A0A9P5P3T9_GYMJU|nr:hypothetical protein CPB84DRAFT_79701 [Gymnopilus junonius]
MTQVSVGEQLAAQGPNFYLPAATAFFRALRVYPAPSDLIVIYEKTIIEPIFKLVVELTQLDMKHRIEAYYDYFPPKKTNVSVDVREVTLGQKRQVLVVNKDFTAGEVIYKEFPVVTALDTDLLEKGTYCAHCLRAIQPGMSLKIPRDSNSVLNLTYCSKACMVTSKNQSHSLLFTLESPLPSELPTPTLFTPTAQEARQRAQAKFAQFIKKEQRLAPLLVARFIGRQVALETQKLVQASSMVEAAASSRVENDYTDSDSDLEKYVLADHLERLRYLEVVANEEEMSLLTEILANALPGLEEFITPEKYATYIGKMAYNTFGVCYGGGRDDRPERTARPEDVEKTRTPYGTQRQIGSALYTVSSYLTHSCQPTVRPSFSLGTSEISIIANQDLKKGDVLTVAFVDVTQHPGESVVECRRRRRFELARGWRFSCGCERCAEEAKALSAEEKSSAAEELKDESKVEETVKKYTESPAATVP